MSQYQTGGSHSFGLVQSPRSDAAPYSGTDKTHLGPRLITPDHYQQTQTRVTSGQTHYDTIPHSDVQLSPRSRAIRQVDFQMSSGLRADVQVAAGQVNTHQTVQPQQVSAGLHNETLRWDSCDDRVEPVSPRSRAILEHGQNIQSAYRPNNDTRDFNTPVSPRGVRVVQSSGQGEDINKSYGGINGARITSRKGQASNVVRSDSGAYHYVDRKDQRDVTYTRASDIMPHNVAGANKVITSTTHTTTREVNQAQNHVDNLIHQGGDGAEHLPTDQCLSPRSRALLEKGQTVENAARPNHDDREHNTPLSPRGVRVVHPTLGGGHEFGDSSGSVSVRKGEHGSNVVRTDGGAYQYVDRADDHDYYMDQLASAPQQSAPAPAAIPSQTFHTTETGYTVGSSNEQDEYHRWLEAENANLSPTSRKIGYAASPTLSPTSKSVRALESEFRSGALQAPAYGDFNSVVAQSNLDAGNPLSPRSGTLLRVKGAYDSGAVLSPRSQQLVDATNGFTRFDTIRDMNWGNDFHTNRQISTTTHRDYKPHMQTFNMAAAQEAQAAGVPVSPRSGAVLRVKHAVDSGANIHQLSPTSRRIVQETKNFTTFDTLPASQVNSTDRQFEWGSEPVRSQPIQHSQWSNDTAAPTANPVTNKAMYVTDMISEGYKSPKSQGTAGADDKAFMLSVANTAGADRFGRRKSWENQ